MSVRDQFKGFTHFIRTQGIAGFAIGYILGQATSNLVSSFVIDLVNPSIGLVFHSFSTLDNASSTIYGSTFGYGHFLSLLINFFIVAAVAYFGIRKMSEIFDEPKEEVKTKK